jgi:hypothetical protein
MLKKKKKKNSKKKLAEVRYRRVPIQDVISLNELSI